MNIRDLKYIIAVADLGNFSRAAERCFVSQPTLSNQIRKVEEQLGIEIFERSNKKVLITEAGAEIIAYAQQALHEVENMQEAAQSSQNPLMGRFRLGAFPTLATYIFPQIIPKIRTQLPDLKLVLHEEKTEQLLDKLERGEIDAALLALPVERDTLKFAELFDDEFFLAVSPQHKLAKHKQISYQLLQNEKVLLLDEGHCLRDQSLEVCHLAGLHEDQNMRATNLETLRQMVKLNIGITFMPKIAMVAGENGIVYIPFKKPQPSRKIALVWRKSTSAKKENLIKNHVLPIFLQK